MFQDQLSLLLLTIVILIILIWVLYPRPDSNYDPNQHLYLHTHEDEPSIKLHLETYAPITNAENSIYVEAGDLIVAHASDDGTVKYYVVPTTPVLDYGFFKQKMDNHDYRFVRVLDPEDDSKTTFLNAIPKMDLITGLPEYVYEGSEEYALVYALRFRPEIFRFLYSEDVVDMAPYSVSKNKAKILAKPIMDIFIQTSH